MTQKLEVWLFADHIGTLGLVEGRLSFCYSAEWLNKPEASRCHVYYPYRAIRSTITGHAPSSPDFCPKVGCAN